jgi:hypothetical protein
MSSGSEIEQANTATVETTSDVSRIAASLGQVRVADDVGDDFVRDVFASSAQPYIVPVLSLHNPDVITGWNALCKPRTNASRERTHTGYAASHSSASNEKAKENTAPRTGHAPAPVYNEPEAVERVQIISAKNVWEKVPAYVSIDVYMS